MSDSSHDFEYKGIVVRAPEELHRSLLREQARRTIEKGQKPRLEDLVIELIDREYGANRPIMD